MVLAVWFNKALARPVRGPRNISRMPRDARVRAVTVVTTSLFEVDEQVEHVFEPRGKVVCRVSRILIRADIPLGYLRLAYGEL